MKPRYYRLTDRDTGIVTNVMAEEVKEHIAKTTEDVQPEPLRLEAGKSYVNRLGEVIGPIKQKEGRSIWPFYLNDRNRNDPSWDEGGCIDSSEKNELDLIREHVPSEPAKDDRAKDLPKVGDRLCCVKDHPDYAWFPEEKVIVSKVGEDSIDTECGHIISISDLWNTGHFEIIPPLPPVRPESVPYEGDEWIYAVGPIDSAGPSRDIIFYNDPDIGWDHSAGWSGSDRGGHYALRRGSAIHRAQPWFHESQLVGEKPDQTRVENEVGSYPPAESEWPEKPDEVDYKAVASWLYSLVDDIDTASDHARGDDTLYRRKVEALQRLRSEVGESPDGQTVVFKSPSQEYGLTRLFSVGGPAPAQYRELGEGDKNEVITKEHEVTYASNGWISPRPGQSLGKRFGDIKSKFPELRARRRIQAPEPVVEADPEFPPVGTVLKMRGNYGGLDYGEKVSVTAISSDWVDVEREGGAIYRFPICSFKRGFFQYESPKTPLVTVDPVSGVTVPPELLPLPTFAGHTTVARGWGWNPGHDAIYDCRKLDGKWDSVTTAPQRTAGIRTFFYVEFFPEAPADERKPREWTLTRHAQECTATVYGPQLEVGKSVTVREVMP